MTLNETKHGVPMIPAEELAVEETQIKKDEATAAAEEAKETETPSSPPAESEPK